MEKVLIADFSSGKDRVTVRGLWQFDRGVKLKVIGINAADVNRVDFAPVIASEAVPVVVTPDEDGTFTVSIPGAAAKSPYDVTAYIYVDTADYGYTVKAVSMPVILRPEAGKPEEEEKPDPFGEVVEKVSGYAKEARDSARAAAESEKAASESATQAEKAKEASRGSAEKASESKEAAATSATAAAESASQARESAVIARSAADEAAESATAAAESKTTAAQQAQNAAQSATNAARSAESASQSSETAKTAADAAGKSASSAQQASRSATESASTATAAAQTATTAAGKAAESATLAGQSAEIAGQKATVAETSASNAAESATAAEKSATAAGDSASAAKTSETAAEEAAQTAQEQAEKIETSAEQIEKNKTDVTSLKEDISNKITKFYASNQGETHLADSDNGKIMDMVLYGKSEQNKYKGINLLPTGISYLEIIEVSISKGTRIFWATDGTPALGGNFRFYNEDKTQETWFGVDAGKTAMTSTMNIDAKYIEFLIPEDQSVKICLGIGDDPVYEPYTGGQPSPSPDWPQEIISAGDSGNIEVDVTGKNLFNPEFAQDNRYQNYNISTGDFKISANQQFWITGLIKVKSNKTYIFGKRIEGGAFYKDVDNPITNTMLPPCDGTAFTTPPNCQYICVNISKKVAQFKENVMLEEGFKSTNYQPYHSPQSFNIHTPNGFRGIPVDSGGNYTDESGQQWICDEVDFERGVYVQRIGIADQDSFSTIKWTTGAICFVNLKANTLSTRYAMTTISAVYRPTWVPSSYATHFTQTISQKLIIVLPNTITTKEQGEEIRQKGFKFAYILGEPIETPLSPEEIAAYKSLVTYYPVTNISVASEQLDGYTIFNYPVSMKNGWDYVKKQLNDNRDYIYDIDAKTQDIDTQSAEAYVNSEYAVALTELEV